MSFLSSLCLRGNPTHLKILHYNVTFSMMLVCSLSISPSLWLPSYVCSRKQSSLPPICYYFSLYYISDTDTGDS